MNTEILFEMKSPYRDDFRIRAYHFGSAEKTVAIVGAMRGDEIQQQYISSRMVAQLKEIERRGLLAKGAGVMVIPSCNPFSMNVSRRFWTMDGTDINRMFPGYDRGETTQRIAAAIFGRLQGYKYGIQMASFYVPGFFVPHVRMLKTGYEAVDDAKLFGLPFVTIRKPLPFDTTLLNYNWQIWDTRAFSLYAGQTDSVNDATSFQCVDAMLRFLSRKGIITHKPKTAGFESVLIDEDDLINITSADAGIFYSLRRAGDTVAAGDTLANILDPYDSTVRERITAPTDGTIFFSHNKPLVLEHATIFRIQPFE